MEVGKLETSPRDDGARQHRGYIFYFILDEEYPDEPRDGHQRYYYVLSATASYADAYCFLCHSLCRKGQGSSPRLPSSSFHPDVDKSVGSSTSASADTLPPLDRNSTKLRQWYQLYLRVFGACTFDRFLEQVKAAPIGRVSRDGSSLHDPTALPRLFADEMSARAALESYRLAKQEEEEEAATRTAAPGQRNGNGAPAAGAAVTTTTMRTNANTNAAQRRGGGIPARQQTSCTPEKTATPKMYTPAAALRPSTAPGKAALFLQHQEAQTRRPAPPAPKLSSRAMSIADLQPQSLLSAPAAEAAAARLRARQSESAATPVDLGHIATSRAGRGSSTTSPQQSSRSEVRELKKQLEVVRNRAECEANRLRMDILELKRALLQERESQDGLVREAIEKEKAAAKMQHERTAQAEVSSLRAKLQLSEKQVEDMQTLLSKERDAAAQQGERWRKEVQQLHEQLRRQRQEHGERLHAIVKENQVAVEKLDTQSQAKEEDLRHLYEDAIQARDVRLAQLSERLLKSEQNSRKADAEAGELRRRCDELAQALSRKAGTPPTLPPSSLNSTNEEDERNGALHREGSYPAVERAYARDAAALLARYERLEESYSRLLQEKKFLEAGLNRAHERIAQQQAELTSAMHLVETLKDGLEAVQSELPILRKEIYLPLRE